MTTTEISQEVRDLAAGIAENIERYGHFQGAGDHYRPYEIRRTRKLACCIRYNPTLGRKWADDSRLWDLERLLPQEGLGVVKWNDVTPTTDVLATLRKIAAGERP